MAKHVIITGATGLIGKVLVKRLAQRGDRITVFVRNPDKAKEALPEASDFLKWDAASKPSSEQSANGSAGKSAWVKAIDGADAIINLAGAPVSAYWSAEHKQAIYDSRILGTRSLVAAIQAASKKPAVLVSGSAIGYYGSQPHSPTVPILTESSPAATDFLAKVCVDWEKEATAAEAFGVRVALIRTGIVLSTKEGALSRFLLPFRLFAGGPIGDGGQWFSWIHLDDEVGIILHALDTDVRGALNATAPSPLTMTAFANALGGVLSRPALLSVPRFALQVLFGEGVEAIAEGQRVVPERTISAGYAFAFPELNAALRDLIERDK